MRLSSSIKLITTSRSEYFSWDRLQHGGCFRQLAEKTSPGRRRQQCAEEDSFKQWIASTRRKWHSSRQTRCQQDARRGQGQSGSCACKAPGSERRNPRTRLRNIVTKSGSSCASHGERHVKNRADESESCCRHEEGWCSTIITSSYIPTSNPRRSYEQGKRWTRRWPASCTPWRFKSRCSCFERQASHAAKVCYYDGQPPD